MNKSKLQIGLSCRINWIRKQLPAILVTVAIICMTSGIVFGTAGCANSQNTKPFNGTVLNCAMVSGGDYEALYQKIPEFEKATGIKVNITYKSNSFELDRKLKMDFAANTDNYDVIWDHTSFFTQYIKYLEPLDGYFSNEELRDFLPGLLDACRRDGQLWMIPRHADISALYYRTDLFDDPAEQAAFRQKFGRELAVPKTWNEFAEVATFFSRPPELYGTQFAGTEEALTGRFYEILFSSGGEFIDESGRAAFNSPAGVAAVKMMQKLYQQGVVPPDMSTYLWDDLAHKFANGQIALYIEWHFYTSYFQNPDVSKIVGKFAIERQPAGLGGIHGGWAGAHAFSIPKSSQNKAAAASLIKFLTSPENMYDEGKIGFLVVRTSVWDRLIHDAKSKGDTFKTKELELAKLQLSEDFRTPPLMAGYIPASNILFPMLQKIIFEGADAQQTLDQAAEAVDKMLSEIE
jgi:multiple sugar transport system substrate-binding protein